MHSEGLTRYPVGSFKEFLVISIPLILLLLSGSVMGFCDRLFLSRYSIEALEACTSTLSLCALFQVSAVRIVSIIQAFIGKYKGTGEFQKMGECVWQMIWMSLFLFLISLPLCFYAENIFFKNTSIASLGIPYFRILLFLNFLLPLGASLSSFYVGQGETKTVLYATLWSHAIHLALDPVLIFGVKGLIIPRGIYGAGFATLIGQLTYCGILFRQFLKHKDRKLYGIENYAFNKTLFWECLRIGMPRSLSRGITLLSWTAVVRYLTLKGGNYLLVLSFGTSIHFLFIFILEGMGQAVVTIGSYIAGIKEWSRLRQLMRSGALFIGIGMGILFIPYILYPNLTIAFIFPDLKDPDIVRLLRYSCYWSYLLFLTQSLNSIGHNLLTAFQDTAFQMFYNALSAWILTYGAIFYTIEVWGCSADLLWLTASLPSIMATLVYFMRAKTLIRRMSRDVPLPGTGH